MRSLIALSAFASAPALAQDAGAPAPAEEPKERRENVFKGDYAIVGVGFGTLPDYDGSNDYSQIPAAGAIGRVGGINFRLRGPSLTLDLIDDTEGAKTGFRLGPSVRYRGNRTGKVDDPVVAKLGELKGVIEAGVSAGISKKRLLTKQDSLSFGTSVRWDISGRGSGHIVSPGISYVTPVSRKQVAGISVSGDFMSGKYARYNYSISPAQSAASGLPAFRAKGGFKEVSAGAFTGIDLDGNLLNGGFALGAGVLYSRLYGSAARTPITRDRGSRNQWVAGAGIAYVF